MMRQTKTIWLSFLMVFACVFVFYIGKGLKHSSDSATSKSEKIIVADSLNRRIELDEPLKRVAIANAYNTDLTELVAALGCLDTIQGVDQNILWNNAAFHNRFTREQLICARDGLVINYERLVDLDVDALIISSLGSWSDAQEKLAPFGIKVIVVDTHDLEQFEANCRLLGRIFGREKRAAEIENYFGGKLAYVKQNLAGLTAAEKRRVYFECGSPGATAVPDSYFYSLVKYTGSLNVMDDAIERHIVPESVVLRNPDCIIKMADRRWKYSYEPPSREEFLAIRAEIASRPGWEETNAVKNDDIFQLSFFSHCGASKIIGVLYVAKYLYPDRLPALDPEAAFKEWLTEYLNLAYIPGHTYPAL